MSKKKVPAPTYSIQATKEEISELQVILEIVSKSYFVIPLGDNSSFCVPHAVSHWISLMDKAVESQNAPSS